MNTFKAGWFVIYTKPRHEKKVSEQLDRINICNFLPLVKKLRHWSDRVKYVDTPLFPSYLFVRLEDAQAYFNSMEMNGVLSYVRSGKQIAAVSETVINNLKLLIYNSPDSIEVCSEHIYVGEMLIIREGVFTGFCCEVVKYNGKQKALVRIGLLKRNILMDIPGEYLMPMCKLYNE